MRKRLDKIKNCEISYWNLMESYQGWQAYVKWADSLNLRRNILKEIYEIKEERLKQFKSFK